MNIQKGMLLNKLRVKKFTNDAILPTRAHNTDAGLDFYSPIDATIPLGKRVKINTHIGVALFEGQVGLLQDRSSMGNQGVRILGGVIDANYRGEIQIILAYVATLEDKQPFDTDIIIKRGDKIAQMIITAVYTPQIIEVTEFESTDRGANGFGSTGR